MTTLPSYENAIASGIKAFERRLKEQGVPPSAFARACEDEQSPVKGKIDDPKGDHPKAVILPLGRRPA